MLTLEDGTSTLGTPINGPKSSKTKGPKERKQAYPNFFESISSKSFIKGEEKIYKLDIITLL